MLDSQSHDVAQLALLPFAEQCAVIEARIAEDRAIPDLLDALGALRDHQPLAHALGLLAETRLLGRPDLAAALDRLFTAIADTGIQRVLRSLAPGRLAASQRDVLVDCITRAMQRLPIQRLAAICLMDRWLKNTAPDAREQVVADAEAAVAQALASGRLDALTDEVVLRLPGRRLAALPVPPALAARWTAWLEQFAGRVLDILEAAPKSLSQANAEQILSRRVYTDPGHFLVELLQNAEDSGARRFAIDVSPDAVRVRHDGAQFDAKDVVGVLSIGQTTKRKDQIGFFGVGFKSVYEICDRPRIYSGPFSFEIADVSMPRRIRRPDELDPDETVLVLRLRSAVDPLRSPAALYARAAGVPPQTLLTLSSLRAMTTSLGDVSRAVTAAPGERPGRMVLTEVRRGDRDAEHRTKGDAEHRTEGDAEHRTEYVIESDRFAFSGTEREASRVSETPVLVGIALDDAGVPVALPAGAATVFSYLPTRERSGLRFLLHAHFDLPVDRERLDLDSAWNRWALSRAGALLARAAQRLLEAGDDRALDGLLDVVPLAGELADPAYVAIVEVMAEHARDLAMLPGADGARRSPARSAIIADPALARALAGVDVDDGPDSRRALAPMTGRRVQVAASLGATRFDWPALLALLDRTLAGTDDGDEPPAAWLMRGYAAIIDAIAAGLARLNDTAHKAAVARLAALPIVLDHRGRLRRASSVARADHALREVYGDARVFVDPALDTADDHPRADLLAKLGVPTLTARDVIAELRDPARAEAIAGRGRAGLVLAYLARLPGDVTDGLGALAIVPDRRTTLRAVAAGAPDAAWLAPGGLFGKFVAAMTGDRPPLIDADIASRHAAFLRSLGARTLDLAALLDALDRGDAALSPGDVVAFHRAVNDVRGDLTPRLARALREARLFPDRASALRPLMGEGRALVTRDPDDRDVIELAPDAPWLDEEISGLAYVRAIGAATVGPAEIAAELAAPAEFDLTDPRRLRRAYAYLAAGHAGIPSDRITRLAGARVWLDRQGDRHALTALRVTSPQPTLAALYRAWDLIPLIEDAAPDEPDTPAISALDLARRLDLMSRLTAPDYDTLIRDLVDAGETLATPDLRALMIAALSEAAAELPRSHLARLSAAVVFRGEDGALYPLVSWRAPLDQRGCSRASAPLRAALGHGARPLLSSDDDAALVSVLDALGAAPASLTDLVAVAQRDPAFAAPAGQHAVRAALVALGDRIVTDATGEVLAALRELPMWPTVDGAMRPALAVVRSRDLGDTLGQHGLTDVTALSDAWQLGLGESSMALLDPAAEADASALDHVIAFGDPLAALISVIRDVAQVGQPVDAQPALLGDAGRVAELFVALRRAGHDPWSLPLAVTASGRLVRARLLRASDHERAICRDLALFDQLADPRWAEVIARALPDELGALAIRQVLAAVAEHAPQPREVDASSSREVDARSSRDALYAWLLAHRDAIAHDPQALGALGRACVIATSGGYVRAPRDLLLDPDLPDVGIDWNAAREVPEPLCAWLREVFAPDDKRLRPLVEHLLTAHERAASDRDGARSAELLGFLARCLRVGVGSDDAARALVKRFKLRKRLRVEDTAGEFARPRTLLAPDPQRWALIVGFARPAPDRVSSRYDHSDVRRLIHLAGADAELDCATLARELDRASAPDGAGLDARLALARYVAELADADPALRSELALARRAWIPDRTGAPRAADQLYAPDGDAQAIVGEFPQKFPHPEFVHTAPPHIASWLPFRRANDAALGDVVKHIEALALRGVAAPAEVLDWLERGLRDDRLEPREVASALAATRFLRDDRQNLRAPGELVRDRVSELFGHRRGEWSAGSQYTQLAAALKIARRPGKREVVAYLAELAAELRDRDGAEILAEEPELIDTLPRCLAVLEAAGGAMPDRIPVIDRDEHGEPALRLARWPPEPAGAEPAGDEPARDVDEPSDAERERRLERLDERAARRQRKRDDRKQRKASARQERARDEAPPARPDPRESRDDAQPARPDPRRSRDERDEPARDEHERDESERDEPAHDEPARDESARDESEREESERDRSSLLGRLRRWLIDDDDERRKPRPHSQRGDDDDESPRQPRSPRRDPLRPRGGSRSGGGGGEGLPDHTSWFRPRRRLGPQLGDNAAWAEDRQNAPAFGFAHAPHRLPAPYLYSAKQIFDRFEPGSQRWVHTEHPPEWSRPVGDGRYRVSIRGRIPAGEVMLPMPAYGRVVDFSAPGESRLIASREGQSVVYGDGDGDVEYTVVLDGAPDFERATGEFDSKAVRGLLAATVPDDELPAEVHAAVDRIADQHARPLDRVLAVRDFIRENYRYDPSYIEDPDVGRFLARISRGRGNAHIAAMHAGRDDRHLGRGVCFELNSLACELLRRVYIPAGIATGWTFDRGYLNEPDHLWAMALMPTPGGLRWLPVDASTTREGTPLHAGRRPPGPWRARQQRQNAPAPRAPSWAQNTGRRFDSGPAIPISDLLRVIRYLETLTGQSASDTGQLRRRCRQLLSDPDVGSEVLAALIESIERDSND